MDIRKLKTHQERKEKRKRRNTLYKEAQRELSHKQKPPNRRKHKHLRRARPEESSPARYVRPKGISMDKATRLQIKQFRHQMFQRAHDIQVLKKLQNEYDMKQDAFVEMCKQRLEENEYMHVLSLLKPVEYAKIMGELSKAKDIHDIPDEDLEEENPDGP
jgi:hypothetical protein